MKAERTIKFLFLLIFILLPLFTFPQQKKYSIDEHPPKERHHLISFRRLFHPDRGANAARKAKRKDDRKKNKRLKDYKKNREKYWKFYNKDKQYEQTGGEKVYKRMKKHKRKAIRECRGKNPDPWIKRIFKRKRKTVKVKQSK